jgi:hypothetical protein
VANSDTEIVGLKTLIAIAQFMVFFILDLGRECMPLRCTPWVFRDPNLKSEHAHLSKAVPLCILEIS